MPQSAGNGPAGDWAGAPALPAAPDRDGPAIRVAGLRHRWPDGTDALAGVDLTVARGERLAVLGPNGSGKTTLALHLIGALDRSAGEVAVTGLPVEKRNLAEIRRRVGLVFQDPDDQLLLPTVGADVALGPANLGLTGEALAERVAIALDLVGLTDAAERAPQHLSMGERRRAALAGVLAVHPEILVLDEPSANLDPSARRDVVDIVKGLDITTVVITHDLPLALELCPRSVVLDRGRGRGRRAHRRPPGQPRPDGRPPPRAALRVRAQEEGQMSREPLPTTTAAPVPGAHGGDGARLAAALGVDPSTVLDLSASMNPCAPDVTALAARHLDSLRRYPDATAATAATAAALGVDADRVVLTNGGSEAIALVAQDLFEGDVHDPEFSLYRRHLAVVDAGGGRWRSNPNNPTGELAAADRPRPRSGTKRSGPSPPARGRGATPTGAQPSSAR